MPALNFLAQLAPLVESGEKRHTVRREAKRPIQVGDRLQLFTGMRTKQCRRLLDTECTRIQTITIAKNSTMTLDGWPTFGCAEADRFAQADGLRDFDELRDWIEQNYGLPFRGVVIHWAYNTQVQP